MYYIYWRGNPQLKNGGYCTVCDKKEKSSPVYGSMCYLGKISKGDFEREFPNGVHGMDISEVKQYLK